MLGSFTKTQKNQTKATVCKLHDAITDDSDSDSSYEAEPELQQGTKVSKVVQIAAMLEAFAEEEQLLLKNNPDNYLTDIESEADSWQLQSVACLAEVTVGTTLDATIASKGHSTYNTLIDTGASRSCMSECCYHTL